MSPVAWLGRRCTARSSAPRFAGSPITLASARKLLKNEDAMIYDNPHALVLCHYKRDRALCHRDGVKDTPSLDHCVPGCGNIARTDQQATQLRERALALESQAAHVPQPVGDRLRATIARLKQTIAARTRNSPSSAPTSPPSSAPSTSSPWKTSSSATPAPTAAGSSRSPAGHPPALAIDDQAGGLPRCHPFPWMCPTPSSSPRQFARSFAPPTFNGQT